MNRALVHEIRVPREIKFQLRILLVLLRHLTLLLNITAHILEVLRCPGDDHIIRSQHGSGLDQPIMLAELQVDRVERLVVVQEHQLDLLQLPTRV